MKGDKLRIADEELVQLLQLGNQAEVDNALFYLHGRVYHQVCKMVLNNNGTTPDCEDLFQDGMIALYKLARRGVLKTDTNVEAYLFTICRNLWMKELKKKKETFDLEKIHNTIPVAEVALYTLLDRDKKDAIDQLLNQTGERCKELLTYYFYDKHRLRKVAELMQYASEQVAKNKKAECMKKLKTLVADNPHLKHAIR